MNATGLSPLILGPHSRRFIFFYDSGPEFLVLYKDLDGLTVEYIQYSVGESGQLDVWEYFRLGRPAVQEQNQM